MRDMVQVRGGGSSGQYRAPSLRMGRSQFNLGHRHKTTFDADRLIPYLVQEVVPGDTMTCKLFSLCRVFSPLDAPIMDDIELSIDFFFVPNRLIWDNWEKFLGASDSAGAQQVAYTVPVLTSGMTMSPSSIANYMGVPQQLQSGQVDVSALPFRAYRLVFNEWYRDQNLRNALVVSTGDGPDAVATAETLLRSAKKHDYFTSALPYMQKGDPVTLPIAGNADIRTNAGMNDLIGIRGSTGVTLYGLHTNSTDEVRRDGTAAAFAMYADLSAATAVTINALREASAIQRLLERDARGGTRYKELINAHFGVDFPDYRAQRPEYLGGGKGYINVSPVANTSATTTENQGQLAGTGAGTLSASWAKSFVEHGWVLGILRARGEVSYQQGLDRKFSRSTRYDFLWPELANLGEQAILNKEIFVSNSSTDEDVFGYQERYAEYRYSKNLVTGKFSSEAAGSLDFWHLAEDFSAVPGLNSTFIESNTPMSRVVAVSSEPSFIIDGRFDLRVARILPVRPVPSLDGPRF